MNEKKIINMAKIVSIIFTPFYWPTFGLLLLLIFSRMSQIPFSVKLQIVAIVYFFTILLPTLLIRLYRKYNGWSHFQLGNKERRMIPYIISIICYFSCYYILNFFHVAHFMSIVIIFAILTQIMCAIVNVWWKISTHTAGVGGITGAIYFFSLYLNFNLMWWLCLLILIGGIVGSSRMILRQHSLSQVVMGYILGFLVTLTVLFYSYFSAII